MIAIFTDGACSGNPGPGGWGCVIATPDGWVRELGGRAEQTTNNRMEMTAVLEALRAVGDRAGIAIVHSDSTYVLGGVTQWIESWKKRGWKTAAGETVKNEDLWRELDALVSARGPRRTHWRWVRGHEGHDANERCDEIAVAFSRRRQVELYRGPILSYPHGSLAPSEAAALPARRKTMPAAADSASATYLSLLDGKLERHATWKECEARVKGRSGARFKKVRSPGEESSVLRSWGF